MLNNLIDDIFVTEGKQANPANVSSVMSTRVVEPGGTGSGGKESKSMVTSSGKGNEGFMSSIFGFGKKQIDGNPGKVDEVRRGYQEKQNLIHDQTRHTNKVVSDFLFKSSSDVNKGKQVKGITKAGGNANRPRRDSSDSLEFGDGQNSIDDGFGPSGIKPSSH
jgi:hypothetical protein